MYLLSCTTPSPRLPGRAFPPGFPKRRWRAVKVKSRGGARKRSTTSRKKKLVGDTCFSRPRARAPRQRPHNHDPEIAASGIAHAVSSPRLQQELPILGGFLKVL